MRSFTIFPDSENAPRKPGKRKKTNLAGSEAVAQDDDIRGRSILQNPDQVLP
jgi:hypothetical protein